MIGHRTVFPAQEFCSCRTYGTPRQRDHANAAPDA